MIDEKRIEAAARAIHEAEPKASTDKRSYDALSHAARAVLRSMAVAALTAAEKAAQAD